MIVQLKITFSSLSVVDYLTITVNDFLNVPLVFLAAIVWDVTQRRVSFRGGVSLRDIPKNGCEGDLCYME